MTACSSSPEADLAMVAALGDWEAAMARGEFFHAHELLEPLWLARRGPERDALKGLIHLSVSLLHHERGNRHGARTKLASARRYLAPFGDVFCGCPIAEHIRRTSQRVAAGETR